MNQLFTKDESAPIALSGFEELKYQLDSLKEKVSSVCLCAELLWEGHRYSDFYGFDIIQKLRLENGVKCTIVVFSFMSKQYLLEKVAKARILNAPGHYFIHLPSIFKHESAALSYLDDDLLNDINYSFFNIRGRVSEITHQLQNSLYKKNIGTKLTDLEDRLNSELKNSFSSINRFIDPTNNGKLDTIQKMILNDLKNDINSRWEDIKRENEYKSGAIIVQRYNEQVYSLLPVSVNDNIEMQRDEIKFRTLWEVLYIDDDQSNLDIVTAYFTDYKIVCHKASTAQEAFRILEDFEIRKKITVLISDFRLLVPGTDIWQEMQGYQILKRVHETHPNPLAYFMLTSKKGTIIKNLRARKDFEILWFAKTDILPTRLHFNPLYQKVKELGDEIYYRSKGEPQLTVWTDGNLRIPVPLSRYYKAHCEASSDEYIKSENNINQIAKNYLDNCLNERSNQKREFQVTLSDGPLNKKMLDKFRESILAGRRIAIGLFYLVKETPGYINIRKGGQKEIDVIKQVIFNYMKPGSNYNKANSDLLFSSTLALSLDKDLPPIEELASGQILNPPVLSEEINFLNISLKIKIDTELIISNQEDIDNIDIILGEIKLYFDQQRITYDAKLPFSVEAMGNNLNMSKIKKLFEQINKNIAETSVPISIRKEILKDILEDINSLHNLEIKEMILKIFAK